MKINHNYFIRLNDDYQIIAVLEYDNNELFLNYFLQAVGGAHRFFVVGARYHQAGVPQDIDAVREEIKRLYDNGYFDTDIAEHEAYNQYIEDRMIDIMFNEIEKGE